MFGDANAQVVVVVGEAYDNNEEEQAEHKFRFCLAEQVLQVESQKEKAMQPFPF